MNIKIKKGFNKNTVLRVDVSNSSVDEKKKILDVFFALGYKWIWDQLARIDYLLTDECVKSYANAFDGEMTAAHCLMHGITDTSKKTDSYMTPQEFFDLVLDKTEEDDNMIPYSCRKYQSGEYDVYHTYTDKEGIYVPDNEFEVVCLKGIKCVVMVNEAHKDLFTVPLKYLHLKPKVKYHTVNGVKIPDLRIKECSEDMIGYTANITTPSLYGEDGGRIRFLVDRGLVYEHTEAGKQAAILHAKALLGLVE